MRRWLSRPVQHHPLLALDSRRWCHNRLSRSRHMPFRIHRTRKHSRPFRLRTGRCRLRRTSDQLSRHIDLCHSRRTQPSDRRQLHHTAPNYSRSSCRWCRRNLCRTSSCRSSRTTPRKDLQPMPSVIAYGHLLNESDGFEVTLRLTIVSWLRVAWFNSFVEVPLFVDLPAVG